MNEFGNEYIIRGIGRTNKTEEIGNAVIKVVNNVPVKIDDVAEIKIGGAIPKIGDGSLKGKSRSYYNSSKAAWNQHIRTHREN